jgi:hypothetical protein
MATRRHLPVTSGDEAGLGRRDALRILAGAVGAGVAVPGLAAGHPLQRHLADHTMIAQADANAAAAAGRAAFLDQHQLKTLQALAERIVPGASKGNSAEFIDQLLAVETQANQRSFLNALGAFEGRAIAAFSRPWVALPGAEQDRILAEASTMESGVPPAPPWTPGTPIAVPTSTPSPSRLTLRDHFDLIKGWVAGAYYSSEIGMRELGWTDSIFHAEFPGCQHPDGHR